MPSKNMLPKGHRHRSVRAEYVATRGLEPAAPPPIPTVDLDLTTDAAATDTHTLTAPPEAAGLRLDQYLAQAIPDISRSRVQLLIEHGQVAVDGSPARPRHKLRPGEQIRITGTPRPAPLHAEPEAIPLDIVFEDQYLAVVNKPAGMMVHAGAAAPRSLTDEPADLEASPGPTQDPRSAGTLVNALLHHFNALSAVGGDLRPGIVHRLDKQTSGLLVVAKDDLTHRRLGEAFAARTVGKTYLALVHGHLARTDTTVNLPIGRDLVRRTRMTTRRAPGSPGIRSAVSHIHVDERLTTPFGPFTRVRVTIETGRTHQIRVHLQALGHPVVGDTLYGASRLLHNQSAPTNSVVISSEAKRSRETRFSTHAPETATPATLTLPRNFLHAAELRFTHPRTGQPLALAAPLPAELLDFLAQLTSPILHNSVESTA